MDANDRPAPPKVYRAPRLTVYGRVRDLTQGFGNAMAEKPFARGRGKPKKSK